LQPVPSSARGQMCSTASKTRKNVTKLNSSAAFAQPDNETRTTGGLAAPVVFLLPQPGGRPAGQEPEGT
jgi:hypothetical protein